MVTYRKSKKEAWNMMVAVLSLGLALLGGIVRLAQVLRLSAPLLYGALVITVFRPWYLAHTALADGIFLVLVGLAVLSWVAKANFERFDFGLPEHSIYCIDVFS
jgi:hypothetical protein